MKLVNPMIQAIVKDPIFNVGIHSNQANSLSEIINFAQYVLLL